MTTGKSKPVIDKTYKFYANASGYCEDYDIHVQLEHEEVMQLGQEFIECDSEDDDPLFDAGISSDYKDKMDEIAAESLAQSFYQNYIEGNDDYDNDDVEDSDDKPEKTLDDFYDRAYEFLAEYYYSYTWSEEFKQDCINYFRQHVSE